MKSKKAGLILNFVIHGLIISLCLACIGCSKKDNNNEDKTPPTQAVSNEKTQLSPEEAQKLKQENENAKKAIAEVLAVMDEEKLSNEKNKELKKAVSKLIDVNEQTEKYHQEKAKTEELIAKFESAASSQEKLDFIESLSELSTQQDLSVIGVISKALEDPDLEVGRAAIELLDNYNTPEILPVVEQALNVADDEIRIDALTSLSDIDNSEVCELLVQGIEDNSKDVRSTALKTASEHSDRIQLGVLENGIVSSHDDVKYASTWLLQERSDHKGLEILLEGLKDTDPQFREEVNETLNFLINHEFETYDEAVKWWNENEDNYDDELFEKEDL